MRPAWSWQFDPDRLRPVEADLPSPITPAWAWEGATGAGVRVAIVDSGVDASHPAVGGVSGSMAFDDDPDSDTPRAVEGPHEDLYGHGTACAAIVRSIAPDVELHSVRVLGGNLKTAGAVFAAGLRWAIERRMHVVNLSLSSRSREYFALFHELADLAYFRNVLLVSAMANTKVPTYPSEYAAVVSVAARQGSERLELAYNPEPPAEFGAPGIDLEVAWRGGGTIRVSGNSFAAPHVTGLAALILSKHPSTTPFQMKTILHALASNVSATAGARTPGD